MGTHGTLGEHRRLGLFTDLYELRMAQTYLREGLEAEATFSLYVRPDAARPWLLAAGLPRVLEALEAFRYGDEELAYLREAFAFSDDFLGWLRDLEPTGELHAVPEGTVVLADEPLLELTGPLPFVQLLETLLMNVVHVSTVLATKAARCVVAAHGSTLADFGARRAHGIEAANEAARAAYLAGFAGTSNVEAGRRFGIPVLGTMAHAFVQAFDDEVTAFRAFAADHPDNVILLVDTYDTLDGVANAIAVGRELRERGGSLAGIRLDSGDLDTLARETRARLDAAGFEDARIFASGGMDEWSMHALLEAGAPVDAFGVGTSLTTSRDRPAGDIVYKMVAYDGVPRAKYSEGKVLLPGPKQVFRTGDPTTDVLTVRGDELDGEALLVPAWRDGEALVPTDLASARRRASEQLARLPASWRHPDGPGEPPTPAVSAALRQRAAATRERELG